MPRPKRPPPGFPAEPRYPRRRTAASASAPAPAPASASAPSPGGGAAGGGAGCCCCCDLSYCCNLKRAFERCRALLDDLLRHDDGWVFEAPVDARALGLRDYYTVIAEPMDLGTVLRRLERRRYVFPTAFAADVRLTFRNAMSFNNKGDPVYESAAELSEIFEARWPSIEAELPHPPTPSTDAERMVSNDNDKLPPLPVAGVPEKRDVRLPKKKGKMAVNLGKADAAALDELDPLLPQHGAAHGDVDLPMQDP